MKHVSAAHQNVSQRFSTSHTLTVLVFKVFNSEVTTVKIRGNFILYQKNTSSGCAKPWQKPHASQTGRRGSSPERGLASGSPANLHGAVCKMGSRLSPAGRARACGARTGRRRRSPCGTSLKYKRTSSNTENARKLRPRSEWRRTRARPDPERRPGSTAARGRTAASGPGRAAEPAGRAGARRPPAPSSPSALGAPPARPGRGATAHNGRGPGLRRVGGRPRRGRRSVAGSEAPPQPGHTSIQEASRPGPGAGQRGPRGRRAWTGLPAAAAPPAPPGTHR